MKTENEKPASKNPAQPTPIEILNELKAKLATAEKSLTAKAAAHAKAKKKVSVLAMAIETRELKNQKDQMNALGVSSSADFAAYAAAAKLGGFKSLSAPQSSSPVSEKLVSPVSASSPAPASVKPASTVSATATIR